MVRTLLRPRWLVAHLLVVALVAGMVALGLWQLRRLDQKRDRNALWRDRLAEAPVPVDDLLTTDSTAGEVAAARFRRVTATGTYRPGEQVLVRGRSLGGAPGSWVVAPLELDDGTLLVVNRGWMANDGRFESVPGAFDPPEGRVRVRGVLQATEERDRFGSRDPAEGRLRSLARLDVARYDRQLEGDALPAWLQLRAEEPAPADAPAPLPLPDPSDEGPHLSYALQWFSFAVIAAVGYPFIVRRRLQERPATVLDPDAPDPDDVPEPGDPRLDAPPGGVRPAPERPPSAGPAASS